jgi:hypothetical protein
LVDEAQDLSALQHRMLRKIVGRGRLIAVGDSCHPEGTTVKVVRKIGNSWHSPVLEDVPVEDLCVGDIVVGYSTEYSAFLYNRTVQGITARPYSGDLITLDTGAEACDYTPNHICLVDLSPLRSHTALYLMRKGEQWRCGIAAMDYACASGPIKRARDEGADALWILETFPDRATALLAEALIHQAYGIPDIAFTQSIESGGYHNSDALARIWEEVVNRGAGVNAAHELLRKFNREIDYPIWTPAENYSTFKRPRTIRACNILPGGKVLPYRGKNREKRSDWVPYTLYRRHYTGNVYSFTISHNHLYVADGLVTHNCQAIYAFRQAHEDSMSKLREEFSMSTLTLSTTFRCPRAVAEHVRWRAPHITSPEWAKDGEVKTLDQWSHEDLPDHATIICRNNAPLFGMAIKLLIEGRRPFLYSNDIIATIVKDLKSLAPKRLDTPRDDLIQRLEVWTKQNLKKYRNSPRVHDKAEAMRVFIESGDTLGEAIAAAEKVAASKGPITLITGHKSKGLEWDNVFFLDEHLLNPDRDPQANNLRYVIATRAKRSLTYVTSDNFVPAMNYEESA